MGIFEDIESLKSVKECAEVLAHLEWPTGLWNTAVLHDKTRVGHIQAAAAVYYDDVYVPRELSVATAENNFMHLNNGRGCHMLISNEWDHGGLRADGEKIIDKLFGLIAGTVTSK